MQCNSGAVSCRCDGNLANGASADTSVVCDMLQRLESAAAFCGVPLFGLRCKCGKSDKPVQLPLIQSVENVSTHAHSRESLAEKTLTGDKF